MTLAVGISMFLVTIIGMEVVAYITHRWIMHGPGWFLHESHHRVRSGVFEKNDLYALIFALPSIALLWGGVDAEWGSWSIWVGAGIAAYGIIYLGFHDVIVHRRIRHGYVPRSRYIRRIMQAHRIHHATESKEGSVSFGFLWAPKLATLKRRLARSITAKLRAPRS